MKRLYLRRHDIVEGGGGCGRPRVPAAATARPGAVPPSPERKLVLHPPHDHLPAHLRKAVVCQQRCLARCLQLGPQRTEYGVKQAPRRCLALDLPLQLRAAPQLRGHPVLLRGGLDWSAAGGRSGSESGQRGRQVGLAPIAAIVAASIARLAVLKSRR